jgi:Pyruvate/2-oxoacid:ferredoxin oxidoreductase delta subunit
MLPYLQILTSCVGCDNCRIICPEDAVIFEEGVFAIETWSCTLCSLCLEVCPDNHIKLIKPE